MNLVIAGCSRRKLVSADPVPALELYQGGCIPALRARVGADPRLRERVRIVSARHGLIGADEALRSYDQRLDMRRARELRPAVTERLQTEFTDGVPPEEILAVLEPLYMVCLADLLAWPSRPRIRWVADPVERWSEAEAVLDEWGWR